jgi:hypothetical protein
MNLDLVKRFTGMGVKNSRRNIENSTPSLEMGFSTSVLKEMEYRV